MQFGDCNITNIMYYRPIVGGFFIESDVWSVIAVLAMLYMYFGGDYYKQ